jgi:hypothetical protein
MPSAVSAGEAAAGERAATDGTPSGFRPLADARPGEWATYSAMNSRTIRYEVVGSRDDGPRDDLVQIRVEVRDGGRPLGLPATREERRDFDPLAKVAPVEGASQTVKPAPVQAAGRNWEATLYEDRWTSEDVQYVRKTWVSPQAPVFGTLRMELTGDGAVEARLELTAYGMASAR